MPRYLFYKEKVSKYWNAVSARPVVQIKVENLPFYCGRVIGVTGISGAFSYNQVFIGISTIGMNKLH